MEQVQLKNVMDILRQVIDLLYQENLRPAYMILATVLPQLEQVIAVIEDEGVQKNILEKLTEILRAMEEQDSMLLADLLQYELLEELQGLVE